MKLSNLLKRDIDVVGKRKVIYAIPAVIIGIALIMGVIFGVTLGRPINFGMDFTGGYTINLKLATKLTDESYASYVEKIENIFDNLSNEDGENYGVRVSSTQHQGAGENASIYIRYQSVRVEKGVDAQTLMQDEINPALINELNKLLAIVPQSITYENGKIKAEYLENISTPIIASVEEKIIAYFNDNAISTSGVSATVDADNSNIILITAPASVADILNDLYEPLSINDEYSGKAEQGDLISPTISNELLTNAIFAVVLALVLMLFYIALRFELASGISAIVALIHDLLVMFSVLIIFHIEINSTFIAALITILGYSINNTIIIFDRVRENMKLANVSNLSANVIANKSVNETLLRSINTSITTLLTISMVAIIGVPAIRVFALPIIAGLLAGTFSSIFIAPSVWAMWKTHFEKENIAGDTTAKAKSN